MKRIFGSGMVGQGALVFAATMVLNMCSFLFHAVASRFLGVANYGVLYSLIALYTVASLPVSLFTPVIAKVAAEFRALNDEGHLRGLLVGVLRLSTLIGTAYFLAGVLFAGALGRFLHIRGWEVPVVGAIVAAGIISGALRAIGQGTQHFLGYAISMASEGVVKVLALLALGGIGYTVLHSTLAFFVGIAAGAAIMAVALLRRYWRIAAIAVRLDWPRIWATTGGAAALSAATLAMGYADVIVVKHFFDPTLAGLYSAASLGGKILLFFVGFVPIVLLPQAADRHVRRERTRGTLLLAMAFIGGASVIGILAYRFFGLLLLHALVGKAFDAALPLLIGYAIAMAFLASTNALASYGIATHRLAFAIPLFLGTFSVLGAIVVVHPSLQAVINEMIYGNAALMVIVAGSLGIQALRERSA